MTYHRTGGKNGTRNRSRNAPLPKHNKNTKSGHTAKPRKGRMQSK